MTKHLHEYLKEYACAHPERPLLGDCHGWLTATEAASRVEALAQCFREAGLHRGDLVAVRALRDTDTVLRILALQTLGAVTVLTDPRHEPLDAIRECDAEIPVHGVLEYGTYTPLRASAMDPAPADARETGFLIFTSGSTGKKKAVMLSQYNLIANLLDSQPLGLYRADDIALGALPVDHVFGLVLLAGVCVLGYAIYFPERTDIPSLLDAIQREKITRMNGVPSLYLAMADRAKDYDLSSLRAGFIGGGPFTGEQFRHAEEALDMTLIPVYGMSECIGIACASWRDPQEVRAGGSAPFYSMNTGKVLREDGSEAAPGETGEIFVNGPARMVGYWPENMPQDALLPTGDLGYLDEAGRLHLTGRKKDIIIRNGINLSARRIEEAILSIPGVEDAAVVGLAHPVHGEVPGAMVCGSRTSLEILAILTQLLNKNELPADLRVVSQLPRTASGKPDKQTVREVLTKWKA